MKKRLVVFLLAAPAIALSLVLVGATALCVKNPALARAVKMYHVFAEVVTPCRVSPLCTQFLRGHSVRIGVGDATLANIRGGSAQERINVTANYGRLIDGGEYKLLGNIALFRGLFNVWETGMALDNMGFVVNGNRREFPLSGERFRYLDQPTMLEILALLENAETAEIVYEKTNGETGQTPLTDDDLCRANKILQMWRDKKPISLE